MNRREMLTAATGTVAGLFLPSVAIATPKRQTLAEYIRSLPHNGRDATGSKVWFHVYCYWSKEYGVPMWTQTMFFDRSMFSPQYWHKRGEVKKNNFCWIYTTDGPRRIDPITTELIPFTPVVGSWQECYCRKWLWEGNKQVQCIGVEIDPNPPKLSR